MDVNPKYIGIIKSLPRYILYALIIGAAVFIYLDRIQCFRKKEVHYVADVSTNKYSTENQGSLNSKRKYHNNSQSAKPYNQCKPQTDIVFLKVHKSGGSSVLNIVHRFGFYRKLVFVLPKIQNIISKTKNLDLNAVKPPPKGKHYNILSHHLVYNRSVIRSLFPNNTFYFAIVRRPFEQFLSAFNFYKYAPLVYHSKTEKLNEIASHLKYPDKTKKQDIPYLDNGMAYDFGLSPKYFLNKTAIKNYISMIDKDFNFVMIMEYFEESLVLLRRYLCWETKDILSVKMNSRKRIHTESSITDYITHKNMSLADYMIYEYFLNKFWTLVVQEGPSFFEELTFFREIQKMVTKFCISGEKGKISIPKSKWNKAFTINKAECRFIWLNENPFLDIIKVRQSKM